MEIIKIKELHRKLKSKQVSAVELAKHYIQKTEKLNPDINAYITMNSRLLEQAAILDKRLLNGENVGPLAGTMIAVKDMICTKDLITTAGSKMLSTFSPFYDATSVNKLVNSGALIIGKTNLDEFGMGSSNENSFFGPVKNPWNMKCVSGGSSGGSAAAQAAGMCHAALGTDTGGSIRQPANYCGVIGIKPTYGRISRFGVVAYASSLDQVGVFSNSVEDGALLTQVMSGKCDHDSTTYHETAPSWSDNLSSDLHGIKIAVVDEYDSDQLDADVKKAFHEAIAALRSRGAEIINVKIFALKFAIPTYYLIASSEASSNLSRYDGVRYGYRSAFETLSSLELKEFYQTTRAEGFGPEVKKRILLGTYCLSAGYAEQFYQKASRVRRLLANQFSEVFKECSAIISPVTTSTAFEFGQKSTNPLEMYLNDIYTVAANLVGLPAMSVPFGIDRRSMPIGIQIMANHFDEQKMFNVAYALEQDANFKKLEIKC